ncbi:MAG: hypothetical protein JO108_32175 [Acidobacteriaceae bacterium]|nr:hypothetical protein [Acidobacteriaceae bacterium]
MALFTDQEVIALSDLLNFEDSVSQVASSHGIDVTTKINLSVGAIGDKLLLWLLKMRASDPQWLERRTIGVSTVVVTPTLYRWLCLDSLSRFFAEAYNVQLNTRFQAKWTEYQASANEAGEMFFMSGLGLVYKPLAKAGTPLLSTVTGITPEQTLYVQTTWVDSAGNESASGICGAVVLNGATNLQVSPSGVVPETATGWNVYAGTNPSGLQRQNANPIANGSVWQLPTSGVIPGPAAGSGQNPDVYLVLSRRIQRG